MSRLVSVLTTGQVASMLQVASRTVCKWMDAGVLSGYCLPGSRDRRFPRDVVLRFMRQQGMPVGAGLAQLGVPVVLAVGLDSLVLHHLEALMAEGDCALHVASDWYAAGRLTVQEEPTVLVIDCALGRTTALAVAQQTDVRKIALACEDSTDVESLTLHFDAVLRKPFDPQLLAELILSNKPRTKAKSTRRGFRRDH